MDPKPMTSDDYPKEVILRDGTGVTLRPVEEADARALCRLFDRIPEHDRWFLDEDVRDPQVMENWMSMEERGKGFSIASILEGRILGLATLHRTHFGSKSHIGEIEISVDPEFRERHLATWMLLELINLAMSAELEILAMYLAENRDSALLGSLKRLGFNAEAVLRNFLKDREGNLHNMVIMVKHMEIGLSNVTAENHDVPW